MQRFIWTARAKRSVGVNTQHSVEEPILKYAADIGSLGPVTIVGSRTQWDVGGLPSPGSREIRAPAGVWSHQPEEMTVRCGAGTSIRELNEECSRFGQMVPFDLNPEATVGGALAVGRSGFRRLRYGHIRDLVLQIRHVDHSGLLVTSGGPTVKNVSGYDLCRLLVGSLGKLGCIAEVTLRCLPIPETTLWLTGTGDPFEIYNELYRPPSILWDGDQVWVGLEGVKSDVESQAALLKLDQTDSPPPFPEGGRRSLEPKALRGLVERSEGWLAEIGVGVVHYTTAQAPQPLSDPNKRLMSELECRLDPRGRLNPGRQLVAT